MRKSASLSVVAILARGWRERTAGDAQRCGDGRHRAGGVLCCPLSAAPMCQCRGLGRERPSLFARRLRPRALTRGSLTPQLSICQCRRRLSRVHRPSSAPPARHLAVRTARSCPPGSESLHRPADREHLCGSQRRSRGHHAIRASSCARRRARLVASLRPRAWSARGLRALTAPARSSPDGNCVMAYYVRLERTPDDACVRKSPAGAFYRIGGHDVRDGSAVPGVSTLVDRQRPRSNAVASGEPACRSLHPGRGQATGARPQALRFMPASGPHPFPSSVTRCRSSERRARLKPNNPKSCGGGSS